MLNLGLSLALGLVAFLVAKLAGLSAWQSILPGLVVGVGAIAYLTRRTGRLLEAVGQAVQKDLMARRIEPAIELLKKAKELGRWQLLVGPQLDGQIGTLLYMQKKFDEAEPHLRAAYQSNAVARSLLKMGTAHAMLACQHFRRKEYDKMRAVFEEAVKAGKGDAILYAVWAFCEDKRGEERKAIEILQRGVGEVKGDLKLKTLLERAQNDKRLKLDAFGELWWQFWLENPPLMQQQGFGGGQGGGFSLRGMKGARGGRRR